MAKTESTAVNELIDLVQNKKQVSSEPAADLFSAPKSTTVQPPPRITATIPPMRGAGEVAPLPRGRAPQSTSQHPMPPPVRMSTADPARGNTIPPISRLTTPNPPRSSSPGLPPPTRRSAPLPTRNTPRSTAQLPSLPPPSAPVAAPFEARRPGAPTDNPFAAIPNVPQQYPIVARPQTVDMTGDLVRADNWFDVSAKVHKLEDQTWVGRSPVGRRQETLALVKKLIAPTIILAIIGIMVGGFFAFDGDGGKKKKAAAPAAAAGAQPRAETAAGAQAETPAAAPAAETAVVAPAAAAAAEPAAAPAPSAESANAGTASAGGAQPEPPTKQESLAKEAAAQAETAAMTHDAPPAATAKLDADQTETTPEAAPVAAKAVATSGAPAPVREVKTPTGVVKLVDVRINSKPSGATVMLVDNGKTSFLGSTPLATSLDPTRRYDVIFTLQGRPTQMAPLDPSKSSRLDVTLGRGKRERSAKRDAAKADAKAPSSGLAEPFFDETSEPTKAEKKVTEPKVEKKAAEPKVEKKVAEPKVDKKAEPAGEGTLMVSSKPPCEIWIDGKSTGLTTPQRSVPLSAGTHKVTFVNAAEGIKKTVSVQITADQSTKLIQDLMKK